MMQEIISIVSLVVSAIVYIEVQIIKEQMRKEKLEQKIKELKK
jgi:hypothetical protein